MVYLAKNLQAWLIKNTTKRIFFLNLIIQKIFLSILSKHVEHNRWPFLLQNTFVDLSISFLHIKHLKIGDIQIIIQNKSFPSGFKIEANSNI